jgi:hypothetical protein
MITVGIVIGKWPQELQTGQLLLSSSLFSLNKSQRCAACITNFYLIFCMDRAKTHVQPGRVAKLLPITQIPDS